MRVVVDWDLCESNGLCMAAAPEVFQLQDDDTLLHFGEDHFIERYQRYQAHIAEWRAQYPHLAAVDLRYDDQIVLQMASGSETAQSSANGNQPAVAAPPALATPKAKAKSKAKPSPSAPSAKKSKPVAQEKKVATPQKPSPINKRSSASTARPATSGEQGG